MSNQIFITISTAPGKSSKAQLTGLFHGNFPHQLW